MNMNKDKEYLEEETSSYFIITLKKIVDFLKPLSIVILCLVLSIGIIGFFVASIIVDNVTINNLNSFIGIVLGIIALTASIVSMFLSFYSIEKSEESDKDINLMLQEMKNIQQQTTEIVSKIELKQDKINETITASLKNNVRTIELEQSDNWRERESNE